MCLLLELREAVIWAAISKTSSNKQRQMTDHHYFTLLFKSLGSHRNVLVFERKVKHFGH
jgi:hypothetical protein